MRNQRFLSSLKPEFDSKLLRNCFKWWGLTFFSLLLTRIVFTLANWSQFKEITVSDFFIGLWIDALTVSLFLFPYFALLFLLSFFVSNNIIAKVSNALIGILIFVFAATNLIDTAYYQFQFSRSSIELFETMFFKIDLKSQFWGIFSSYWWLFLLFAVFIYFLRKFLKSLIEYESDKRTWKNSITLLLFLGVLLIIGRGGIRPRPIGTMDLSRYSENTQLIGNTPFFLVKTIQMKKMRSYNFLQEDQAISITHFHKKTTPQNILPDSSNVVVLILESFGNEFSKRKDVTPFLNSILEKSWSIENAFANGLTSMEGIPAIVSSMPTFSQTNYISSRHGNNQLDGLASVLKRNGYSSGFFHGATNGSMNFDAFSSASEFDNYFGRSEYNNEEHFDGSWGIYDDTFLPWSAERMNEMSKPFLGVLFNLSSHHPYLVPENLQSQFNFDTPIEMATAYSDYSLQLFFEEAQKHPWFENTLFVLVADHTSASREYETVLHPHKIPLAFYHPKIDLKEIKLQPEASQVDIFPTVLDLLNVQENFYSAGNSLFDEKASWKFLKWRDNFLHITKNQILEFQVDEFEKITIFTAKNWNGEEIQGDFSQETLEMKAFLQQISSDVKSNKTSTKK